MWKKFKEFLLDLLFPPACLGCQREGNYLCEDCLATLEISQHHQKNSTKNLADLYFALPYQNPLIKNLIQKFKYEPFIKELAKPLTSLILNHFQLLGNKPDFFYPVSPAPFEKRAKLNGVSFILIPIPLDKKRLRWRGFNQAEEIGKELASFLLTHFISQSETGKKIPLINNALIKIKETLPQVELLDEERKENIKGVFLIKNKELIKNKKILLIDDIYTTGSTMEECARVLKEAGAKEVIGIVVIRAKPKEDHF